MTQFALFVLKKTYFKKKFNFFSIKNNDLFISAAQHLFHDIDKRDIFTIEFNGKNIDELCTNAQMNMTDGETFEKTYLYECIKLLSTYSDDFALWYGSDFLELDIFDDFNGAMNEIEVLLSESSGEIHIHFQHK